MNEFESFFDSLPEEIKEQIIKSTHDAFKEDKEHAKEIVESHIKAMINSFNAAGIKLILGVNEFVDHALIIGSASMIRSGLSKERTEEIFEGKIKDAVKIAAKYESKVKTA